MSDKQNTSTPAAPDGAGTCHSSLVTHHSAAVDFVVRRRADGLALRFHHTLRGPGCTPVADAEATRFADVTAALDKALEATVDGFAVGWVGKERKNSEIGEAEHRTSNAEHRTLK